MISFYMYTVRFRFMFLLYDLFVRLYCTIFSVYTVTLFLCLYRMIYWYVYTVRFRFMFILYELFLYLYCTIYCYDYNVRYIFWFILYYFVSMFTVRSFFIFIHYDFLLCLYFTLLSPAWKLVVIVCCFYCTISFYVYTA